MAYTKEEQLVVNLIKNLQKASELSDLPILFCDASHWVEVELTIRDDKTVLIEFCNQYAEESYELNEYTFLLSTLRLG